METVPNRERPSLLGRGTLLVSCPRNRWQVLTETMARREVSTWSDGVEVGPPSNVNIRVEGIANPGRSFAAAIGLAVPRRAGSHPSQGSHPVRVCAVIERQKTGRVV
jgi:hypothetical protein